MHHKLAHVNIQMGETDKSTKGLTKKLQQLRTKNH